MLTTNGMLTSKRLLALPNRNGCSCNRNTLMYSHKQLRPIPGSAKHADVSQLYIVTELYKQRKRACPPACLENRSPECTRSVGLGHHHWLSNRREVAFQLHEVQRAIHPILGVRIWMCTQIVPAVESHLEMQPNGHIQ